MLKPATTIKSTLMAATLALSAFSLNAQAALTSYTVNGTDLVYSSISNVSYTKDANLLGTMIANSTDADGNGTLDVIDAIVAASQGIYYDNPDCSGITCYNVTAADFTDYGRASWYGSMAFVTYLNTINYGGSNSWYLPNVTYDSALNGGSARFLTNVSYYAASSTRNRSIKGDELIELVVDELNYSDQGADLFTNWDLANPYWFSTAEVQYGARAFVQYWDWVQLESKSVLTGNGGIWGYTWAVTQGMVSESTVSAVPAPAAAWLFATGLPVVGAFVRRRKQQA